MQINITTLNNKKDSRKKRLFFFIKKCKTHLTLPEMYSILYVKLTLQHIETFAREMITIKNIIAQLRKERGITQQELADMVSVTRQTIISLENGKYNPSINLAYKIAKRFDKTIEEIFIFEEEI